MLEKFEFDKTWDILVIVELIGTEKIDGLLFGLDLIGPVQILNGCPYVRKPLSTTFFY